MVVGNYKTQILHALWGRIRNPGGLNGCFWYPLDGWLEGDEMMHHFKENGFEL